MKMFNFLRPGCGKFITGTYPARAKLPFQPGCDRYFEHAEYVKIFGAKGYHPGILNSR